jgi:hypothetical protein
MIKNLRQDGRINKFTYGTYYINLKKSAGFSAEKRKKST